MVGLGAHHAAAGPPAHRRLVGASLPACLPTRLPAYLPACLPDVPPLPVRPLCFRPSAALRRDVPGHHGWVRCSFRRRQDTGAV